ncbi:MAG: hypothetical protein QM581_06515 [Pseudomonas sp.]
MHASRACDPPAFEKRESKKAMTAADAYLAVLRESFGLPVMVNDWKQTEPTKPQRLEGGCLLFDFAKHAKKTRTSTRGTP